MQRIDSLGQDPLQTVINATGIILHTGLGRASLAPEAIDAIAAASTQYAAVELDIPTGKRGRRSSIVQPLLTEMTGAQSATVVNNNAGALLVTLAAIAAGREVIVSRGELIEIGGSFRLPEVIAAGGAILREVGTTNRTRAEDFDRAVGDNTAAILSAHTSNYTITGFSESARLRDLVQIGRKRNLPVIYDIGSGLLAPAREYGLDLDEPDVRSALAAGADLVLFSGDKLLGGPQAGIIVGRSDLIDLIERHPLMRALRVDKITLAGLGATLQLHRDHERAVEAIPAFRMMTTTIEALETRAQRIVDSAQTLENLACNVRHVEFAVGGGSAPTQEKPSVAVMVTPRHISEQALATRLRLGEHPVIARVKDGAVWLDVRTIFPEQLALVVESLTAANG